MTGDRAAMPGDDAIVVAEGLGTLAPLEIADVNVVPRTAAVARAPDARSPPSVAAASVAAAHCRRDQLDRRNGGYVPVSSIA
jgi:hypothetical protein